MQQLRAFAAGVLLLVFVPAEASAQTLTSDLFNPAQGGFAPPGQSLLRKNVTNAANSLDGDNSASTNNPNTGSTSRVTKARDYGIPPASGASDTGFDSLNRKLRKPKPYPGAPKPKFVGPGNSPIGADATSRSGSPSIGANRSPLSPSLAGTSAGQPPRRRLKIDDDPFGNVGNYYGGFLVKSAVEVSGGYDSNPGRLNQAKSSPTYIIAPEFLAASNWSRHSLIADLRGSYTGYSESFPTVAGNVSPVPTSPNRPDFLGLIDGRLDVTRDTRINSELRLRVATDNPGSPNIQVGLAKYPLATTVGGTLGVEQDFSRLQVSVNGLADQTVYQESKLTDGNTGSNDDRNFNQYGVSTRVSYDLLPGVKPFGEVVADTRLHEIKFDRFGFQRDSTGGAVKAGSTFEFSRLLTGDIAVGYALRNYEDSRLTRLSGLLTSASLAWSASGLTTVKLIATSSIDESTLPGVSGSLSRDYLLQVDHAFRRWLIGTAKIGYGTTDYGVSRFDTRYLAQGDLIYKLNRTFAIKGSVRQEWLDSNLLGFDSKATIVLLGIRVQR